MAITVQDITTRFPEFASLDPARIQSAINEAGRSHNAIEWGPKSDDGLAYFTAHLLAKFGPDSGACSEDGPGPVTSEREGQVAVSYAISSKSKESDLGSTKYGRYYLRLQGTLFVRRCV